MCFCAWVYVCVSICLPLSVCKCDPECIVYVCVWHNFLPIFFHNLNQRKCINFAGVRGAYIEPVNKSILLLPTMPCQVHTSSQHIIINCTLNHSVQLTMWEWMERERYREKGWRGLRSTWVFILKYSIAIVTTDNLFFGLFCSVSFFLVIWIPLWGYTLTCFYALLTVSPLHISIFSKTGCIVYGQEICSNSTCPSVLF